MRTIQKGYKHEETIPLPCYTKKDVLKYDAKWADDLVMRCYGQDTAKYEINESTLELYYIVSGEAKFEDEKGEYKILTPTETRFHKSYEPHAITTYKKQILSFVIWKNKFEKVSKIFK